MSYGDDQHDDYHVTVVVVAQRTWLPTRRSHVGPGPDGQGPRVVQCKAVVVQWFYEPVVEHLKVRLTTFFRDCKKAWAKVLEIKGNSTTAEARRSRLQERPTKAPVEPLTTPVDD